MNNAWRQKSIVAKWWQDVRAPLKSPLLAALRVRQWTKNLIVFAAPLFALNINLLTLLNSTLAFSLFCAASSSFYLINDIIDVKADRCHPIKCKRPIAAGLIGIPVAVAMAVGLLSSALLVSWLIKPGLGAAITGYAILQIAYNFRLKRTVILDVIAIATGFVLRAYAGAAISNVTLSSWFLLCTAMLALFLAIEKRKAELRLAQAQSKPVRAVLRRYSLSLLDRMEGIVTTGVFITYALWSSGPRLDGASTRWMLLTLPLVLYGIFRYQFLSDPQQISRFDNLGDEVGGKTERPEEILLSDRPILLTVIAWVLTTLTILLLKQQNILA